MALVRPFAALRPRPDVAARVAAVPYDVVNTEEARALAQDPLSFLHVSRAEIDLPAGTDPYADAVYAKAASNLNQLRRDALLQEERPAIYLYRLRMGAHEQLGVAAAYSVDEYRRDLIKKHERTRPDKENDRTRHIIQTRAQSGPVLLTYRETDALAQAMTRGAAGAPLYDFTAADGIQHTIWMTTPEQGAAIVAGFAGVPALYIADGHHRAASASRACDHFASASASDSAPSGATADEHARFLAVAFPEQQTQILPYHRIVKDLAGRSADEFLTALRAAFPVERGSADVRRQGDCAMFLAGQWYTLSLDAKGSLDAQAPSSGDPIAALDVSRLQDQVLAPLLNIHDPRTDKRIDFVGGIRGTGELEQHVDSGRAAVAFALFPTTVGELMAIADAGGIMPPKSTWFEPKLRDGLLTHLI
jgi:uncharacterized protein (DUF1015 family)